MYVCMYLYTAVGCSHPNFVGALGVVHGAPQQQLALVLPLIAPTYTILGGPPSFASVTRDTFPADKKFSLAFILKLLLQVASACWHLHTHVCMYCVCLCLFGHVFLYFYLICCDSLLRVLHILYVISVCVYMYVCMHVLRVEY
jgi:hypothetical protein